MVDGGCEVYSPSQALHPTPGAQGLSSQTQGFQRFNQDYNPSIKNLTTNSKTEYDWFSFAGPLANLAMFTKARLSVQPISDEEWTFILALEEKKGE